jgi:hypothetical protein
MAFSATKLHEMPFGNRKMVVYDLSFGSVTEGLISTGLVSIDSAHVNNETTETDGRCLKNKSDASTASNGDVFCDGFTSDDSATLTVIGV